MTTQIVEYSKTEAALADLSQRYKGVVFDVATRDGMMTAIKGRAELRNYRVSLEKLRVELKAPALERTRLIDAEAKRITAELVAMEEPIDEAIKTEETRKEREKAEREEKERQRVAEINEQIAAIGNTPAALVGKPSGEVAEALSGLGAVAIDERFAEFKPLAQAAKARAMTALQQLLDGALAQEQQQRDAQARAEAERLELARLRREQQEREAAETERVAAQQRADADARAQLAAEQKAAQDKIDARDKAAKDARDKADAEARAARELADQEAKAARDAEAKRQADEAATLKAQRDKAEVERREIERLQNELLDGADMLRKFVERFGKRREFAAVVKAINAHLNKDVAEQAALRG